MSLSYVVPQPVEAPSKPPTPSQDEVAVCNPRATMHDDTAAVMHLIANSTGISETKALGLVVTLAYSEEIKRMQTGGYDNPGRAAAFSKASLSLSAITVHLKKKYPNLQCPDVYSQVQMLQAYYFCTETDEAVKEQLKGSWDKDFTGRVCELRDNLGAAFCTSSGAGEVMKFIETKAEVYAKQSHSSRLIQIVLGADLAATVLHRIRENPACLDDLPEGMAQKFTNLLAKERTLSGVAYNVASPITIEKIITLTSRTKTGQFVPADYTVLHLTHFQSDEPSWDVLKNYELFAVTNCPTGQLYDGYHVVGYKSIMAKFPSDQAGGKMREEQLIATIFTRNSTDRLKHDLYLMAAVADTIHSFLRVPVSKQSFSYRAGAAYRSEIQRILVRFGLVPSGSITPQPKSKGKKKKNASKTQGGSDTSSRTSETGSTAARDPTGSITDWSADEQQQPRTQPENTDGQAMLLQDGLPGMAIATRHGLNSVQEHCVDYITSVSALARDGRSTITPTSQAAQLDDILRSSYGRLHEKIVKCLHPSNYAKKISITIDSILKEIAHGQQQQTCKVIGRDVFASAGIHFNPGQWQLAMLRIVCAVVITNLGSKGIEPFVEGLVLKSRGQPPRGSGPKRGSGGAIRGGGRRAPTGGRNQQQQQNSPDWAKSTKSHQS